MSERAKLTIPELAARKAAGDWLVMVAVGEAMSAAWAARAGIDIIGIGDSLGMTLHGHENTLAITVDQMIDHARAVRRGAPDTFTLVSMPFEVGKAVDEAVGIFTFSIGAGSAGTCQLLNGYDLIGAFDTFTPRFAKRYCNIAEIATKAFSNYADEVRSGAFPDDDHSYQMRPEEAQKLRQALQGKEGQ